MAKRLIKTGSFRCKIGTRYVHWKSVGEYRGPGYKWRLIGEPMLLDCLWRRLLLVKINPENLFDDICWHIICFIFSHGVVTQNKLQTWNQNVKNDYETTTRTTHTQLKTVIMGYHRRYPKKYDSKQLSKTLNSFNFQATLWAATIFYLNKQLPASSLCNERRLAYKCSYNLLCGSSVLSGMYFVQFLFQLVL